MANTQALKRRIGTVKNTKQITKAMELVAASKMRKAQEATLASRAYRNSAREILARLGQLTKADENQYFAKHLNVSSVLYVLFTSDRGLAGAYNSNILRLFMKKVHDDHEAGRDVKVIVIGKKGAAFVSKLKDIELIGAYNDWPTYPTLKDIRPIFESVKKSFTDGESDEVHLLFTDFISSINQVATDQILFPASLIELTDEDTTIGQDINDAVFEPSPEAVLETIVPRLIEMQLFQASLEAISSEQSMRMLAMKNASDNAGDLIDDLTLEFNSARQAAITQEIAEITGGAAALS